MRVIDAARCLCVRICSQLVVWWKILGKIVSFLVDRWLTEGIKGLCCMLGMPLVYVFLSLPFLFDTDTSLFPT